MNYQEKTKDQLIEEIARLEKDIFDLKKDYNDRKAIEEELIQEQNLYLDLANAQPAGIYRLRVFSTKSLDETNWQDPNNSPYVFDFYNDRFCELLKLNKEELNLNPGKVLEKIFEQDRDDFSKKNVEANLHTTPFLWEGRFLIENNIRWIHLESLPRLLTNGDTLWTGILYDVTDLKDIQLEITSKNEQLVKANAEKDKFFSIIAHDLKSPFNSFLGLTQIMAEKLPSLTMAQIEAIAVSMRNSATNLFRLLENLLQWSRIHQGMIVVKPEQLELLSNAEESLQMMFEPARSKNIKISCAILNTIQIFADRNMVQTIMRNLISNAVKYTPKGGLITITAKHTTDNFVEVAIQDTGIGMSATLVSNLFQLDTQTTRFGTEGEPSTGLGLILCKEFVEKHGGKIWVESQEGNGSTFHFTIPRKDVQ